MRRAGGYAVITDPNAGVKEADTYTCFHCNTIVHVPVKADPANIGGLCKQCMKLVCPRCTAKGTCDPWEEQMKRAEAAYHARRSYGL